MLSFSRFLLIIGSLFLGVKSSCQTESCELRFNCIDNSSLNKVKIIVNCDSINLHKELTYFQNSLINLGHLRAEVVDFQNNEDGIQFNMRANQLFKWNHISYANKQQKFNSQEEFENFISDELTRFENSGFPFCQLETHLQFYSGQITGEIYLERGPLIVFDNIILQSASVHSTQLVSNLLEIKKGAPYSEKLVNEISSKIKLIPYLRLLSPPSIIFKNGKANVYLSLEKVNSNTFDGIAGIQPSQNQATSLTGEFNLDFLDAFKRGERIKLNWQRINNGSQELFISGEIPYLLKSKLGLSSSVQIYRRDSTANRLLTNFDIIYNFKPKSKISFGFFTQNNNANLNQDSDFQNTKITGYQFKFLHASLDKEQNPRSGISITGAASAGNRALNQEKQPIILGLFQSSFFQPIKNKSTVHLFVNSQANFTENLFINELDQIGGLGTIRGVDHRSIFVSKWITTGLEYRFLFEENSNFMVFTEQNFYQSNTNLNLQTGNILAIGLGLNVGIEMKNLE